MNCALTPGSSPGQALAPAERARGPSVASNVPALKGDHAACFSFLWVPASAGMTVVCAGMTWCWRNDVGVDGDDVGFGGNGVRIARLRY